jgi:hypothetical protein
MDNAGERMVEGAQAPNARSLAEWLGPANYKRWNRIVGFIDSAHPGVFAPDWVYGGKKHGWGLRFKKSKSFCTLIPEHNRLRVLIVFGAHERDKAELVLHKLSVPARDAYAEATTYHDGKWVLLSIDNEALLADVMKLLAVKRAPKPMPPKRREAPPRA